MMRPYLESQRLLFITYGVVLQADNVKITSTSEQSTPEVPSTSDGGPELPPGITEGEPRPAKRTRRYAIYASLPQWPH